MDNTPKYTKYVILKSTDTCGMHDVASNYWIQLSEGWSFWYFQQYQLNQLRGNPEGKHAII